MTTHTNAVIFGENLYHITPPYAAGVRAARTRTVRFDAAPHRPNSQRALDWSAGFDNTEQWDHILPDGTDIVALRSTGQRFEAPEPVA